MADEEAPLTGSRSLPLLQSSSSTRLRSLESLLLAAQQQQIRQLRRLQQLKRQAQAAADVEAAWARKQAVEEARLAARRDELQRAQVQRASHAAEVEARRDGVAHSAAALTGAMLQAHQRKMEEASTRAAKALRQRQLLGEFSRIAAAKEHLRRQHHQEARHAQIEAQRRALVSKEARALHKHSQLLELQALQKTIRREEQEVEELRRQEAAARAAQEAEAKEAYYATKQIERERVMAERHEEIEARRRLRSAGSARRVQQIQEHCEEATRLEEEHRAALQERLASKMARADAVFLQRQTLCLEAQRIKRKLLQQEERMKEVIGNAQRTGNWAYPPDILQELSALESTITSPYPASPRAERSRAVASAAEHRLEDPEERSGVTAARAALSSVPRPLSPLRLERGTAAEQYEAELQSILEEEILKDMQREVLLKQVMSNEERKRMLKVFAAERQMAKARILSVGSKLTTPSVVHTPRVESASADERAGDAA